IFSKSTTVADHAAPSPLQVISTVNGIQDRHDESRLQHPPAGSARADGSGTRLSALTGGVCVASCKGPRGPDRGLTSAQALQPLAQLRLKSPKASIVRGSLMGIRGLLVVNPCHARSRAC